jgi:hypothetical protein
MISRKVVALFCILLGFGIGTLYWAFPSTFTAYVISPIVGGATWFVDFVLYAPLQFAVGLGLMAFVTLGAKRLFNTIGKRWFKSKSIPTIPYQGAPAYSQQPQVIGAPTMVASQPTVTPIVQPQLEVKKQV